MPLTPVPVTPKQRAACLYAWDVDAARTGGVTDSPVLAAWHIWEQLQEAPVGAQGVIRCVALAPSGRPQYVEVAKVARAHREVSGVSWVKP
jgi:hypothetical protein